MQQDCIATFETNKYVRLQSPTGSGKTLAFLACSLPHLTPGVPFQMMILAPSRELAIQIADVWKSMQTGMQAVRCYGGHDKKIERNQLKSGPEVVIGTPGRLADHLRSEKIQTDDFRILVVDEYDKALEFGFEPTINEALGYLPQPEKIIFVSATDKLAIPERFSKHNFQVVKSKLNTADRLKHLFVHGEDDNKADLLIQLVHDWNEEKGIVFFNHREAVDRMSDLLYDLGIPHDIFHGGLEQHERERTLTKLRNESVQFILSTDLASRGLDLPELDYIVHYQLPHDEATYIHRNGRTARMRKGGKSLILLTESEYLPNYAERPTPLTLKGNKKGYKSPKMTTLHISAGKQQKISKKDILGYLIHQGKLEVQEVGRIEVMDRHSLVAIPPKKLNEVIQKLETQKIKKTKVKVSRAW